MNEDIEDNDFPYEEIRKPSGDYFDSWKDAKDAGYDDDQIWSVTECDDWISWGPPHHYVNHIGHVATKERHDGDTYYQYKLAMYDAAE